MCRNFYAELLRWPNRNLASQAGDLGLQRLSFLGLPSGLLVMFGFTQVLALQMKRICCFELLLDAFRIFCGF